MHRLSVKNSLLSILCSILFLFGLVAYFAIEGLSTTNRSTAEIATNWLPGVRVTGVIALDMARLQIAFRDHVVAQTEAEMNEREALIPKAADTLRKSINDYYPLIASETERALINTIKQDAEKYVALSPRLLVLSRENKTQEASEFLAKEMGAVATKIRANVNTLVEMNVEGSQHAKAASEAAFHAAERYLYLALGLAALIVVGAIAFVMKSITSPLTRITNSMRLLAGGDTASLIPHADRADEIGTIAGAVEVFRQAAIAHKQLEKSAEEARARAEADRILAQEKAEADAAERLRIATSGLAAGLKRLASGDLAFQLTEPFAPDFETLRHDFNHSVSQLATALSTISQSIMSMDTGTQEISAGASDLSKRTEQQAASLEQTAAALDQITANVNSSAKRTEEARSVANQANDGATRSAQVVSQAVDAMQRIETSSQQISNIIGVIDEIAFQTNLLALNAGVEAARAGEAGKGFAVVAQEVRELAQRSAQAAKEIKALIHNSSTEVEGGVKLVRDAGEALQMIGEFIAQINVHMDAIATSTKEQSTGLAEVNSAVNSLDQTTQQNAAMVEESTAASSSLALEAGKLRELVAQFKVNGGATSQANQLRQTLTAMAQPARSTQQFASAPRRSSGSAALAVKQEWEEF